MEKNGRSVALEYVLNRQLLSYAVVLALVSFMAVQVLYLRALDRAEAEIKRLEAEKHELQEHWNSDVERLSAELDEYRMSMGGLEEVVQETVLADEIVFPVHEDDFMRYTSPYGRRKSPFLNIEVHHTGVDIAAVWRAQIRTIAAGRVVEHYPPPGTVIDGVRYHGHPTYGGMVRVDHGGFTSLYAHLDVTSVRTGDELRAGEYIGRVGNTGESRGYHLHLELEIDGERVNPLLYLQEITEFEGVEDDLQRSE